MFQSVEVADLYYNHIYKIVAAEEYAGVYTGGKFWHNGELYLEFDHSRNITGHLQPYKYFLSTRKFYKFVSQKITYSIRYGTTSSKYHCSTFDR